MPITIYKNMLCQRVDALGRLKSTTQADLSALELRAQTADESLLKPIRRKDDNQTISLHNIGGIPSVKLGRLGSGNFARIYLHADGLSDPQTDHVYAVKVICLDAKTEKENKNLRDGANHEIHVAKGLGQYIRHGERKMPDGSVKIYIVLEYIRGYTLFDFLDKIKANQLLTMTQSLDLMQRLLQKLARVHALEYAHGDLHIGNIMVGDDYLNNPRVHLIDFNLSRPKNEFYYINPPVPHINDEDKFAQIPPECRGTNEMYFTPASDIYALGAVFNSILRATEETMDPNISEIRTKIRSLTRKMRLPKEKRIDLPMVARELTKMEADSRQLYIFPLKSEQYIPHDTKKATIWALQQYFVGQRMGRHTWRSLTDATFLEKSKFITTEIDTLRALTLQSLFIQRLCAGLINYIANYIVSDLDHYSAQPNLGGGIECFIQALKACGNEVDKPLLIDTVSRSLPKNNDSTLVFVSKLEMLLISDIQPHAKRKLSFD